VSLRIAVVTGRIGDLDPLAAGTALGRGLAPQAQVAVVPVADGGPDLAVAMAALWEAPSPLEADATPRGGEGARAVREGRVAGWRVRAGGRVLIGFAQPATPAWAPAATTADLGEWVASCLAPDDGQVVLDLTGVRAHDGGRGLLAAAGDLLRGREVVGLVHDDELALPATGIGGGLARRAFAARIDVAELLEADAALAGYAGGLGVGLEVVPGGGAAGGCGLAVLASGGRLVSTTQFCHQEAGLDRTLPAADLVLTGCTELSALDRGGPVVTAVARWAEEAQRPCVLVTTGAGLARRELRTMGIESVHLIAGPPSGEGLTAAAGRIAAGWYTEGYPRP
jgi:glycerate kinase